MTSSNQPMPPDVPSRLIQGKGLTVRSALGLYEPASLNRLVLLSVYGSPQQTRAIFGMLATRTPVTLIGETSAEEDLALVCPERLRMRGRTVGYGKHHILLWDEQIAEAHVVWPSPDEKDRALRQALATRMIPYDPAWLPDLERLLLEREWLVPLEGWGPAQGYRAAWDDDAICTAILDRFVPKPVKQPTRSVPARKRAPAAA